MAKLFSQSTIEEIQESAKKSTKLAVQETKPLKKSVTADLDAMMKKVQDYFSDYQGELITSKDQLHSYIDRVIEFGYAGIDTETTGLDRINDTIVGASLYSPNNLPCYIPMMHKEPIQGARYKGQLSYEEVQEEFQRLVDSKVKLIFANADFDLSMIYKDLHVDMNDVCYYDVILAWRVLKENELHNGLKELYCKYVLKGNADPMKFSDFFSPALFPHCKPAVALPYASNDAKITYELYLFQLPYVTKSDPKCQKKHLEGIAGIIWNIEFPMIKVCQNMHRNGIYIDKDVARALNQKYDAEYQKQMDILADMVQQIIYDSDYSVAARRPFARGKDFNPNSNIHCKYLCATMLKIKEAEKHTDKTVLTDINLPVTNQILKVRSLATLINTFVKKLPSATTSDNRIHAQFRSVGADTGRMCIAEGTEITVLNGTKRIEDIVPGDIVYCYSEDGTLQLSRVKNLWMTGKSVDCVDVKWQSSGKGDIGHLICTPEHKILMKSGDWVAASELKRYDKVAHLRRTVPTSGDRRPQLYGWNGLATREQDVVKYSLFNCYDSTNMVIHHVDEDPSNNSLDNLRLLELSKHTSNHTCKMITEGTHKYAHLHSDEINQRRIDAQNAAYQQSVIRDKQMLLDMIRDAEGRVSKVSMDYTTFLNRCEIAGIDVDAECRKYNPRYHKPELSKEEFLEIYDLFEGKAIRVVEHLKISYDKFYSYCNRFNISRNHMIQSVTYAGKFDVYDIEVEGYHNFIASEICVHNSSAEPNLQNIPSHAADIRHMFRATAAQDITVDADYDASEDTITVSLCKYDRLQNKEGELVSVENLEVGQVIKILEDGKEIYRCVKKISSSSKDSTLCDVVF